MFVISLTRVSCLLVSAVSSLVLQLPQGTDGELENISRHYNFTATLISSNSSTSPSNSSINTMETTCDKTLGSQMHASSCLDALHYMRQSPVQTSFGERDIGTPDIGLPYRFLSCKLNRFSSVGQIGHPVSLSDLSGSGRSMSD